jgi:hypothetical protein
MKTWGDGGVQSSGEQASLIIGGFRDRVRALEAARGRTFPVSGERRSPENLSMASGSRSNIPSSG